MGKIVGILLAGGKGERVGSTVPKQFLYVGEKMLIEYSIEKLENTKEIDEIYVVVDPRYREIIEELKSRHPKITKIVNSGRTKNESIKHGALALDGNVEKVIIHLANRPFVHSYVFSKMIKLLDKYEVVSFCCRIPDYVVKVNKGFVSEVLNRKELRLCKSPVAYRSEVLKTLINVVPESEFLTAESDIELLCKYLPDVKIYVYESTCFNFKITYKEDLKVASLLLLSGF
ncbi:MAG: 2-C-methyl-D-erythritol 4-phosphate cytidylyltransferase [Thermococcus sp.]|uniref:2-C-methyl-D-erythritol 4-phosphate cytidylyltransferase n=1 Tax=Thermococcus sp. TaxID=35749 RepID=UPI001DA33232|nr:2-C-methyl-D-erythritol 4-phosphate cytidylyltransferase [Thermococcus sp.]MBO8174506.1 2-C-methyl-D-erythritol 4-phosphate cytidylyltransferase [Thermococcus sp.]